MRKVQIIFNFLILIVLTSCASQKSTLIILGTVHLPTENINSDSIYNVLKSVKPDFILMEADTMIFDKDFNFKKSYDENEFNAVSKYKKEFPNVNIRPIEFKGRNIYRKKIGLYPEASEVLQELNSISSNGEFKSNENEIWMRFANLWMESDSISNEKLRILNDKSSDLIIDSLMNYQYFKLLGIINNRFEFDRKIMDSKDDSISLKSYYEKWSKFEGYDRGNGMTQNIINWIQKNPKKKFIVLTGFKHRNFLLKNLINISDSLNIEIKEFYDK